MIKLKNLYYILQEHTGRVFRLQFDEFQIVSSSHDDTIIVWDFLNYQNNPEIKLECGIEINGTSGSLPTTTAPTQAISDNHPLRSAGVNPLWPVIPVRTNTLMSSQNPLNINNHSPALPQNSNQASAGTQYLNSDHSQNNQAHRHNNNNNNNNNNSPPSPMENMEGDD